MYNPRPMGGHDKLSAIASIAAALVSVRCTPHIDEVAIRSAGDHQAHFEHGGIEREVLVHVPAGLDTNAPAPLVVVLHGAGSSGSAMAEVTGFSGIADREGFVAVYPDALGVAHGMWRVWNTGTCFAPACWFGVDDVGMVAALLDLIEARIVVDTSRIYLVGYSNGGELAFNAAARLSYRLAGLAVYAGKMTADGPVVGPILRERRPAAPLSVMTMHADRDPWIPRDGAERLSFTDVSQAHIGQFWAASARCPSRAERYLALDGVLRVTHFKACAEGTEVKQLAISGWNHEWPAPESLACKPDGDPLRKLDAAEVMWRFLRDKRRLAPPVDVER